MRTLLLLILICSTITAGEALPPSANAAMDAYTQAEAKAKAEYNDKEGAARVVLVKALQKALKDEMKKENLDGATAIQNKIKEMNKEERKEFKVGTYITKESPNQYMVQLNEDKEYVLIETNTNYHSITSKIIDNKLVMQWSYNSDLFVLEKLDGNKFRLSNYSNRYKGKLELPSKNDRLGWSYELTIK